MLRKETAAIAIPLEDAAAAGATAGATATTFIIIELNYRLVVLVFRSPGVAFNEGNIEPE